MTRSDDWMSAWRPMTEAVGRQFEEGEAAFSADEIERSAIRRYLEPLEFDCPLHHDREAAQAQGYADVLVPTSALPTFALGPMWRPGEVFFTSADRNAQPAASVLRWITSPLEPPTTGYFATNFDVDYLLPAVVGDRLLRRGARLLGCLPKETKVGRGAFLTWESEIVNQRREVVARLRTTFYRYNPHSGARP